MSCFHGLSTIVIVSSDDITVQCLELNNKDQIVLKTLKQKSFEQLGFGKGTLLKVSLLERLSESSMLLVALTKESNTLKLSF